MKKLIFTMLTLCLMLGISYAQESEVTLKPIKKGEEPKAVLNAIKQDFPNAVSSELRYLPSLLYNRQWSVNEIKEGAEGDFQYISVLIKERNQSYEAVYDKMGDILHTKTIVKKADLPSEVMNTIETEFPGYSVINDREKITSGKDRKSEVVYRIEIRKGNKGPETSLFLDNSGKILREVHSPKKA